MGLRTGLSSGGLSHIHIKNSCSIGTVETLNRGVKFSKLGGYLYEKLHDCLSRPFGPQSSQLFSVISDFFSGHSTPFFPRHRPDA